MNFRVSAQTLLAVAPFVSTEQTRPYIGGIHLEEYSGRLLAVATDGHCLAARLDNECGAPCRPVTIRFAKPAIAALRKKSAGDVFAEITVDGLSEPPVASLRIISIDQHGRETVTYIDPENVAIDGTFPDWRRVVPQQFPTSAAGSFGVNPQLLAKFGEFARIFPDDGLGAMLVTTEDPDFLGVVMPRRAGILAPFPQWAVRTDAPQAVAAE